MINFDYERLEFLKEKKDKTQKKKRSGKESLKTGDGETLLRWINMGVITIVHVNYKDHK